jgi:hypothetical protein
MIGRPRLAQCPVTALLPLANPPVSPKTCTAERYTVLRADPAEWRRCAIESSNENNIL